MKRRKKTTEKKTVAKKNKKRRLCICVCIKQGKPQGRRKGNNTKSHVQPKNIQYVHTAQNENGRRKNKTVKCWQLQGGEDKKRRSCNMFSLAPVFFAGRQHKSKGPCSQNACCSIRPVMPQSINNENSAQHTYFIHFKSPNFVSHGIFFFLFGKGWWGEGQYSHFWTSYCLFHKKLTESLFVVTTSQHFLSAKHICRVSIQAVSHTYPGM